MEHGFYETHISNVKHSKMFGVTVPGPKRPGTRFFIHCAFLISIDTTVFLLFVIQMVQMKSMIRICVDFIGSITILYGLYSTLYVAKVTRQFKGLLREFDEITDLCIHDPLDPEDTFYSKMLSDYKYIKMYSKISVPVIIICAVAFFALNTLRSLKIFGMDGQKILSVDIWLPNTDKSPYFEISQMMAMSGILVGATQKQVIECLILSLLSLLCTYFDHLAFTAPKIFSAGTCPIGQCASVQFQKHLKTKVNHSIEFSKQGVCEVNLVECVCKRKQDEINLKGWIKIHQKTLRLSRELTDLLSPLLAFYLVNVTSLVAIIIFTITLGEIQIMEILSLFNYSAATGISLFAMCYFGTKLTEKSKNIAEPVFWKCFENGGGASKESYSCLKITFQRTLQPLVVSPFRSSSFQLSRNSFLSFGSSIISFYLAIKKIKGLS